MVHLKKDMYGMWVMLHFGFAASALHAGPSQGIPHKRLDFQSLEEMRGARKGPIHPFLSLQEMTQKKASPQKHHSEKNAPQENMKPGKKGFFEEFFPEGGPLKLNGLINQGVLSSDDEDDFERQPHRAQIRGAQIHKGQPHINKSKSIPLPSNDRANTRDNRHSIAPQSGHQMLAPPPLQRQYTGVFVPYRSPNAPTP